MPVYVVQGKLGTGKSKYCVGKIQDALREGRRVATNLDLFMEHLCPPTDRQVVMRVPDKPTAVDLDAIGHGNPDSYDEDRNGVLVLDELASWLNSRQFQSAERAGLIDWLVHARKKGWDVYLIVQNVDMIDKQVRVGLAEYLVKCIRADKIRIPIIGGMLGKRGRLPRFHIANVSMADVPGVVVDRDFFRGDELHDAYDTRQVFREGNCGLHSLLPAWHLKGRHVVPTKKRSLLARILDPEGTGKPLQQLRAKLPLVSRLSKLPPDRAVYWASRLCREGLL